MSKRLDELIVVDRKPDNEKQVFFGAWVELENEKGDIVRYRIVGPDEFDVDKSYISMDSPVAKSLLRKFEGDEIEVISPKGKILYSILEIRYTPFD